MTTDSSWVWKWTPLLLFTFVSFTNRSDRYFHLSLHIFLSLVPVIQTKFTSREIIMTFHVIIISPCIQKLLNALLQEDTFHCSLEDTSEYASSKRKNRETANKMQIMCLPWIIEECTLRNAQCLCTNWIVTQIFQYLFDLSNFHF